MRSSHAIPLRRRPGRSEAEIRDPLACRAAGMIRGEKTCTGPSVPQVSEQSAASSA